MSQQLVYMNNLDLSKEKDALKFAYALLDLQNKLPEVTILNKNPKDFDSNFVLPRDVFAATYTKVEDVSFKDFWNLYEKNRVGVTIMMATDRTDRHRIGFTVFPHDAVKAANGPSYVLAITYDSQGDKVLPYILEQVEGSVMDMTERGVFDIDELEIEPEK